MYLQFFKKAKQVLNKKQQNGEQELLQQAAARAAPPTILNDIVGYLWIYVLVLPSQSVH